MQIQHNLKIYRILSYQLYSNFSKQTLPKLERYKENPKTKDFHKIASFQMAFDELHDERIRPSKASEFTPLTDVLELDPHSQKFKHMKLNKMIDPNTKKLNKIIKKGFNKKIGKTYEATKEEKAEISMQDTNILESTENRRRALEYEQFKRLEFEKLETKRLLTKEGLKHENILKQDEIRANRFENYKQNMQELKNQRISNFLDKVQNGQHNKKLAILIQSGLLNKDVNIAHIIDKSLDLLKQGKNTFVDLLNNTNKNEINKDEAIQEDSEIEVSNDISNESEKINTESTRVASANHEDIQSQQVNHTQQVGGFGNHTYQATNSNNGIGYGDISLNQESINGEVKIQEQSVTLVTQDHLSNLTSSNDDQQVKLTPNDTMTIDKMINLEGFLASDPLYPILRDMPFKLSESDLKGIDFSKLRDFFQEFLLSSSSDQQKLIEVLHITHSVREYENDLFRSNLPVRGRLDFTDLTPVQQINYLKYNIIAPEGILEMWDSVRTMPSPSTSEAMIEKLALFMVIGSQNNPTYPQKMLCLLKDDRYKAVLKYVANNFGKLGNDEMAKVIWSLGRLHRDEGGILNRKLWEWINVSIISDLDQRVDTFKASELSFLCEGLLDLSSTKIMGLMEDEYKSVQTNLIKAINKHIDESDDVLNNLITLKGFALFASSINNLQCKQILDKLAPIIENLLYNTTEYQIPILMDIIYSYSSTLAVKHDDDALIPLKAKTPRDLEPIKSLLNKIAAPLTQFSYKLKINVIFPLFNK